MAPVIENNCTLPRKSAVSSKVGSWKRWGAGRGAAGNAAHRRGERAAGEGGRVLPSVEESPRSVSLEKLKSASYLSLPGNPPLVSLIRSLSPRSVRMKKFVGESRASGGVTRESPPRAKETDNRINIDGAPWIFPRDRIPSRALGKLGSRRVISSGGCYWNTSKRTRRLSVVHGWERCRNGTELTRAVTY